ncbi:hypothetical protein Syun_006111 [Stephania yunnanensis]|uniref:Uncharacterized protein n=1 Tax=Stephania yunnanensis TaxID=152371 RepID=A0AAP0KX16_9MAGN
MEVIVSFILMRQAECTSMEEVYHHLEQLFIDMLHFFLSQLPIAILKEVNESPVEAHEERARFVLKLLYKLKSLEDKIQWSFPEGYRLIRLMDTEGEGINDEAGNTENQNATPVDDYHEGGATTIQEFPDVEMGSQATETPVSVEKMGCGRGARTRVRACVRASPGPVDPTRVGPNRVKPTRFDRVRQTRRIKHVKKLFSSGLGPTSGHTQIKAARAQELLLHATGPGQLSSTLGLAPPNTSCSGFSIPYEMKWYGHGLYLCPQNRLLDA